MRTCGRWCSRGAPQVFAAGADIGDMADRTAVDQLARDQTGRWAGNRHLQQKKAPDRGDQRLRVGWRLRAGLMCDLIVAGDNARLGQPEINLASSRAPAGLSGGPARPGKYVAMEAMSHRWTGDGTGGPTSLESSTRSCRRDDVVVARRIARQLADKPPLALRMAKEAVSRRSSRRFQKALRWSARASISSFRLRTRKKACTHF